MGRCCLLAYQAPILSQNLASFGESQKYCINLQEIHKNFNYAQKCNFTLLSHATKHHSVYPGRAFAVANKKSFTQPQWLLPMSEEHNSKDDAAYELDDHADVNSSTVQYKVIITTSNDSGSAISFSDAGVLLAIIGEHGRCCVSRISPFDAGKMDSLSSGMSSQLRFQSGATDIITFFGPDLGTLEAIWVAPEAGTWRIGEAKITVFPQKSMVDGVNIVEDSDLVGSLYDFKGKDILIGDRKSNPAIELKASLPCQLSYKNYLLLGSKRTKYASTKSLEEIREKGMKEYKIFKVSSLSYNFLLVIFGTAISFASGLTEIAEGFSIGGLLGLFNLLFLQRAVDRLPAPNPSSESMPETVELNIKETNLSSSSPTNENEEKSTKLAKVIKDSENEPKMGRFQVVDSFSGFRAPLTRFSVIIALAFVLAKWAPNTNNYSLSKEGLLAGAAGFLMSKIAVVLASSRPMFINTHE